MTTQAGDLVGISPTDTRSVATVGLGAVNVLTLPNAAALIDDIGEVGAKPVVGHAARRILITSTDMK